MYAVKAGWFGCLVAVLVWLVGWIGLAGLIGMDGDGIGMGIGIGIDICIGIGICIGIDTCIGIGTGIGTIGIGIVYTLALAWAFALALALVPTNPPPTNQQGFHSLVITKIKQEALSNKWQIMSNQKQLVNSKLRC